MSGEPHCVDDLVSTMGGNLQVTFQPNNPDAPHPRFSLYKSQQPKNDQQERRKRTLELQKEQRFNVQNHIRNLTDDSAVDEEEEAMDVSRGPRKHHCFMRKYSNQLMLSEWMVDIPDDFPSEWLMKPCPVGKRNLIVAAQGKTRAFQKSGLLMNQFPSALPGGRHTKSKNHKINSTVLDCIYSEVNKTFYILDIMNWKTFPLYGSETECRWFLLNSHFEENPEPTVVSRLNPIKFEPLPWFNCDKASIESAMKMSLEVELDGLLFYHKRTHYTLGCTPLVLWLKAYMLPELLGVEVSPVHMQNIPSDYQNFQLHADKVKLEKADQERKQEEKKQRKRSKQAMETETPDQERSTMDGNPSKESMDTEICPPDAQAQQT